MVRRWLARRCLGGEGGYEALGRGWPQANSRGTQRAGVASSVAAVRRCGGAAVRRCGGPVCPVCPVCLLLSCPVRPTTATFPCAPQSRQWSSLSKHQAAPPIGTPRGVINGRSTQSVFSRS